jgi:hypothetical protein
LHIDELQEQLSISEKERGQLAEQYKTFTMATQQSSELSLQLAAVQKELQETKQRQELSFFSWPNLHYESPYYCISMHRRLYCHV